MKTISLIVAGLCIHLAFSAAAQPRQGAALDAQMMRDFSEAKAKLNRQEAFTVDPSWVLRSPPAIEATTEPAQPAPQPQPSANTPVAGVLKHIPLEDKEEKAIWKRVQAKLDAGFALPDMSDPDTTPSSPGPVTAGLPSSGAVPIPGIYTVLASDSRQLRLKAYLLPGDPLVQAEANGPYRGTFNIAVSDIDALDTGDGAPVTFSAPITFKILNPSYTDPDDGALSSSAAVQTIAVSAPQVANGLIISVRTPFDPGGRQVRLPLAELLEVSTTAASIEGLGLEATNVHVTMHGLPEPEGTPVVLSAKPGAFFDAGERVKLDKDGLAQTTVRSRGLGPTTIVATLGRMKATTSIEFGLPWLTVIASLLGGLVGSLVRAFSSKKLAALVTLKYRIIAGMLLGLMVVALYIIGVNVLPISPVVTIGPVVVFALAALAGYLGVAVLPMIPAAAVQKAIEQDKSKP